MTFTNANAHIFIPNLGNEGENVATALAKTTDLCIGAHQDDIEVMAYGPIAACFGQETRYFTGVTVTDGGGSPRTGVYADYTDEDMKKIRVIEQNNAAQIGRYAAQVNLVWPSSGVKDPSNRALIEELKAIILAASPDVIYTHNIADKHDTHVGVTMHVIRALRELPAENRPRLIGMEVWRSLDWLCDEYKVVFDNGAYPNLSMALMGVYDSQISGGKRYDLAAQGRRVSNATFYASHAVDVLESAAFGLDMSAMIKDNTDPEAFITEYIQKFAMDVTQRVRKLK
ncbi:MAG: PIG-L family deacetylase [Defluviitaleaceae bacterium]|nr:PIG-L family deacetylase [Defluviitaleaceae bacterium]